MNYDDFMLQLDDVDFKFDLTPNLMTRPRIFRIPAIHDELISDMDIQYLNIKGGRGGFKTTSFICAMIEESYRYKNCAFLFTREIARSIEDSVYSVVEDLIRQMGDGKCYMCDKNGEPFKYSSDDFEIGKKSITNKKTVVKFIFMGLRATGGKTAMSQINKAKGLHKIRIVMMEEGQDLSEDSLNVLLPTANRKGTVALVRNMLGHQNYNPSELDEEEAAVAEELEKARFFIAMNPNKESDPIVVKMKPFVEGGIGVIAHVNMMDIGGSAGDTEPRDAIITINGVEEVIQTEPDLQDEQLLNQMFLEKDEYYSDHVWYGAPFHRFQGKPFSAHEQITTVEDSDIMVIASWLDPSFKGGDYCALSHLGRVKSTGKVILFGTAWKCAWNMSPAFPAIVKQIRKWGPDKFWFEDNSLGTVPKSEFAREGLNAIGVTTIINKEDKIYKVAAFTKDLIALSKPQSNSVWFDLVVDYTDEAEYDDPPDSAASLIVQTGMIKEKLKF